MQRFIVGETRERRCLFLAGAIRRVEEFISLTNAQLQLTWNAQIRPILLVTFVGYILYVIFIPFLIILF